MIQKINIESLLKWKISKRKKQVKNKYFTTFYHLPEERTQFICDYVTSEKNGKRKSDAETRYGIHCIFNNRFEKRKNQKYA